MMRTADYNARVQAVSGVREALAVINHNRHKYIVFMTVMIYDARRLFQILVTKFGADMGLIGY